MSASPNGAPAVAAANGNLAVDEVEGAQPDPPGDSRIPPTDKSLQCAAAERDRKAREMMVQYDSETESNLSRPPSPDRHNYPKHRLSGLQSRDNTMVQSVAAEGLALVREASPHAPLGKQDASDGETAAAPAPSVPAAASAKVTHPEQEAPVVKSAAVVPNGVQRAKSPEVRPPSRPSSPPPTAMSPPKAAASTKVSNNTLGGPGTFVPQPQNGTSNATSPPAAKSAERPALPDKGKDSRGMLRRMFSAQTDKGDRSGAASPSKERSVSGQATPSSRNSSPPGSPNSEINDPHMLSPSQVVQFGGQQGHGLQSPPASNPPSRNTSLKRAEKEPGADGAKAGDRLTAAALRDWDAKGKDGGAVAGGKESGKKSGKDGDAKSSASSTLRDMIMGSAPKLSRRGSNTSHGGGSQGGGSKKGGSQHGGGDTASLLKKYGVCEKAAIGKGATAVVRLAHKWDRSTEKLYAVKEFRKRRKNETEKEYVKKLTSEFCISSTLHHINIVETVDLVQDENRHWCEVMEYCPGGDLYAAIKRGGMSQAEVECCFKQVIHGIAYLHSMGVAHRDIKPENLLLDGHGHVKITDFGVSDVFRMCWEKSTHYSKGLCGSEPYIAPEQFENKEYDARLVDVWAAGVVFYCMQFQELPWRVAKTSDPTFKEYLAQYSTSSAPSPLSNLSPRDCRPLLKKMLCPDPKGRWGTDEILRDPWLAAVPVCEEGQPSDHKHTIVPLTSSNN